MARKKETVVYFCQNCGYEAAKWTGQCPSCNNWNTFVEEKVNKVSGNSSGKLIRETNIVHATKISDVVSDEKVRILTGINELDRVLGGGFVNGSLILVGGDPGIGKSTLLLQVCRNLSLMERKVLYVSGEESLQQIKLRSERMGKFNSDMLLMAETNLDIIEKEVHSIDPEVVIIDSIQTMYDENVPSSPGSVSQVREATGILMQLAKKTGVTIVIVGHVTKEGTVAGPRVLEHMVDTVLYFEGDRFASYRVLRGVKNRFGSTNEIGVFEMAENGLIEVENPSEFMLNGRAQNSPGSIVACSMEGTRPILIEVQALVCNSNFGIPRRTAAGTDINRVNLLMAVLEKRLGMHLSACDAYINIAGGMKMKEPAIDLGIILAIVSSYRDIPIKDKMIAFGEIGLSGEIRAVSMVEQRISEAEKLGFLSVIIPEANRRGIKKRFKVEIIGVSNVKEAIDACGRS